MENQSFHHGARIVSEGYTGTVLYTGQVAGTKGDWLGVEWDDTERGKHDGSHNGVHYFKTRCPTSGSFIRTKKASLGQSFMDALHKRYGLISDESAGIEENEMFVMGKNQKTTVEVVGAKSVNMKQSQFEKLTNIVIRGESISSAGPEGDIARTIPNVEQLDVCNNLLSSWEVVAAMTKQLPKLHSLNISGNRLTIPDNPESLRPFLNHVKILYLNRMNYTWDEVLQCLSMMERVKQLHVCFNCITRIQRIAPSLECLEMLNLESNALASWDDVLAFGNLKHLDTLILNSTGLDRIEFPDVARGQKTALFPSLNTLYIADNKIEKLYYIDELDKLKSLTNLVMRRNPLMSLNDQESVSAEVIARIGNLKFCNRSDVTSINRKGAQLEYIKRYGRLWRSSGGDQDAAKNNPSAEFMDQHPRYQRLIDIYGPPEDSELIVHTTALKGNLINVIVQSPKMPHMKPLKKKLPATMTLQKLKTMLQRIYKVDILAMKIAYCSQKMDGPEIKMDSDLKEITYYSIEDGDVILVTW